MNSNLPPDFKGNKWTLYFYDAIFYFIIIVSYLKCKYELRIKDLNINKDNNETLFLTRDWGTYTSMNIELYNTIEEFIGSKIKRLEINKNNDLITDLISYLKKNEITHLVFDVRILINRNGVKGKFKALKDCYVLGYLCKKYKVVPICGITDLVQPGQQMFAELITLYCGIIVSWGSVGFHEVKKIKHNRLIGPLFLPISNKTINNFRDVYMNENIEYDISSIGSNYEPRKSFFTNLEKELKSNSITFYFNLNKNLTYIDYLGHYSKSLIGINTSWIGITHPNRMHFTHRNFEIIFSGSVLFSQSCYGLNLYLKDGVDYISYLDVYDLIKKIKYYLINKDELQNIAISGKNKVLKYLENNFVWEQINYTLKYNNIKPLKN
jgi:hypothetical protein